MIIVFLILCTDAITGLRDLVKKRRLGIPGGSSRKFNVLKIARIDIFSCMHTTLPSTLSVSPSVSLTSFFTFLAYKGSYCITVPALMYC